MGPKVVNCFSRQMKKFFVV